MPRSWSDKHTVNKIDNNEDKRFYRSIVADKKPYFMMYIYPDLMKQYKVYTKNADRNALREFGKTVDEIKSVPYHERTKDQNDFLQYYRYRMPVGMNDCVMNKICRRFEQAFDGLSLKRKYTSSFDYTIMKSDAEYSEYQYKAIKRLYNRFNRKLIEYMRFAGTEKIDKDEARLGLQQVNQEFYRECCEICPNEDSLCNIVLDMCYKSSSTKRFAWNMCGEIIIHNLLKRKNTIFYPSVDPDGDVVYCGDKFSIKEIEVNECQ